MKEYVLVPSLKIARLPLAETAPKEADDPANVPTLSSCAQMHHLLSEPDNRTTTTICKVANYNNHPLSYSTVNTL